MSEKNRAEELDRLRAHLEVMRRYDPTWRVESTTQWMEKRIAQLEAEADPWREAKKRIESEQARWEGKYRSPVIAYVRYLEAENAAKAERIAELEARPMPPLEPRRVRKTIWQMSDEPSGWMYVEPYPIADAEGDK